MDRRGVTQFPGPASLAGRGLAGSDRGVESDALRPPATPGGTDIDTGDDAPAPGAVRFGLVDIGSNAVRVQISELTRGADGAPRIGTLLSHRAAVRLGRDVFLSGSVPEATVEALLDTLARFRDTCDRRGVRHIEAIATSAMRDATNRQEIVERVRATTGIDVRVIPGSEEAWLLTAAVRSRVDLTTGRSLLVDLGGGSVEVSLVEDGELVHTESWRLGALRVLHALEADDGEGVGTGGGGAFLDLLDEYVGAVQGRIREQFGERPVDRYVATGGNIDSIADVLGGEGRVTRDAEGVERVGLDDLKALTTRLAQIGYHERIETFGLRPDRADTILPAAVVYYRIGRSAGASWIDVPRVGMRDGLLQELVHRHLRDAKAADHRDTLLSVARALGRRYRYDARHADVVRRLSVRLFDGLTAVHQLGEHDRTLLEVAAELHDIGVFVSNARHHKHSWYLIRASEIAGLSDHEREIVALIARYHRRAHPQRRHWGWSGLTAEDQRRVHRLAAILRLADSLDRGHRSKIADLAVEVSARRVVLTPVLADDADADLALERLGVQEKGKLFREVFGRAVELRSPGGG